jgi:putative phosphoesterase
MLEEIKKERYYLKILVFSDSHGSYKNMKRVLLMHKNAEAVIYLGDGLTDLDEVREEMAGKAVWCVKGNNDWLAQEPLMRIETANGERIYMTHGHAHGVKYGLSDIINVGRENKGKIVCFGRTHVPFEKYEDGMYIFNPGSVTYSGTYGIIEITQAGIMTNIGKLW